MSGLQSALLGGGGGIKYWVSGATYAQGDNARSPTDHQLYVRIVAGAGTTDPASDATNWLPDGARAIKSIQRGYSLPGTVTITAVNMSKTALRYLGAASLVQNSSGSLLSVPSVRLASSTTISVAVDTSNGNPANSPYVSWELTEYY